MKKINEINPVKILFITGLHGNEINSDILINNYLKEAKFDNITIDKIGPISDFESRDVSFNLNRLDEVNNIFLYAKKMKKLIKKIKEYDIIIDSHNTPLCKNIILHSSKEDRNYPHIDNSSVIWREAKFDTISEYCRKMGKISFTIETQGMYYINGKDYKEEFQFLDDTIKLCLELFSRKQEENVSEKQLFTEDNKLRFITLYRQIYMNASDVIVPLLDKENIATIDNIVRGTEEFDKLLDKNSLVTIISPSNNFSNSFEGTIRTIPNI